MALYIDFNKNIAIVKRLNLNFSLKMIIKSAFSKNILLWRYIIKTLQLSNVM